MILFWVKHLLRLLDGCLWSLLQIFNFPRGWILMFFGDPLTIHLVPSARQSFHIFNIYLMDSFINIVCSCSWFPEDIFKYIWWSSNCSSNATSGLLGLVQSEISSIGGIVMKFCSDIHGFQRMSPDHCGDFFSSGVTNRVHCCVAAGCFYHCHSFGS